MKVTWPTIVVFLLIIICFLPGLEQYVYGYPSDLFTYLHTAWWRQYALDHNLLSTFNPLINYPVGISYLFPFHPVIIYPLSFLSVILDEVRAYNILFFTFLTLNFLTPLYVLRKLLNRTLPALLAAFFIAFSQYTLWHGMQNIEVFFIAPLVLFIWLLFRFQDGPSVKNTLSLAVVLALGTLSFFQYGYFLALLLGIFFLLGVGRLLFQKYSPGYMWRWLLRCSTVCLVAGVLTLPWTWKVIVGYIFPDKISNQFLAISFARNSIYDLVAYGGRPWDYLIPSIFHPLFGRWVQRFYTFVNNHHNFTLHSTFLPERANFIPLIVWALALLGSVVGWRDGRYRDSWLNL